MTNPENPPKADELFFVVDENNVPFEPLPRRLVHGFGIWHRVSHVWLVNSRYEVLCQKRSRLKELHPGWMEPFFGGHLKPGETDMAAALRETFEETGLRFAEADLHLWETYKYEDPFGYNNEFQAIYVVRWDGDLAELHFADGEVERVEWLPATAVQAAIKEHGRRGWTECGYEQGLLRDLIQKRPFGR